MAIEQKRLIRLIYRDKPRIIEPRDYGVHKGSIKLLAYQTGGLAVARFRTAGGWR